MIRFSKAGTNTNPRQEIYPTIILNSTTINSNSKNIDAQTKTLEIDKGEERREQTQINC